jgi:DNA-directed RNA polymerase specialized sigma24 family protein
VLLAGQPGQARPEDMPAPAGEIWEVVRQLSIRQRTAIVLRFVADLTEADIARTMSVSRTTAASALVDGRRNLAKLLEDHPSMTGAL